MRNEIEWTAGGTTGPDTCGTCGRRYQKSDHLGKPARESGDCSACLESFMTTTATTPTDFVSLDVFRAANVKVAYRVSKDKVATLGFTDEGWDEAELVGPIEEIEKLVARMQRLVFGS